jgi:hypothetical protein
VKKQIFIIGICLFTFLSKKGHAQYYYYNDRYYDNAVVFEGGGTIGLMNCLTDLGGKKGIGKKFIKDLNLKDSKMSFGIYFMAMYQNKLGLRLEGTFGKIAAYDSILKPYVPNTSGRYERNLSFRSNIIDFQLSLELHPIYMFGDFSDKEPPMISPYLVGGIGYFSFDPEAYLNGEWHRLQPLHTEGQGFDEYRSRKPYKLSQVNYPVGAGFKYELSPAFNLRLELVHRILATDYLDDVSTTYIEPDLFYKYLPGQQALYAELLADRQRELNPGHVTIPDEQRGDPKSKDSFFSIQFKLGFTFGRELR